MVERQSARRQLEVDFTYLDVMRFSLSSSGNIGRYGSRYVTLVFLEVVLN